MDKNNTAWACRRGMLELDRLLLPFFEHIYPSLETEQQQLFQQLLQEADQDLFNWLIGYLPAKPLYQQLISKIQQHATTHRTSSL